MGPMRSPKKKIVITYNMWLVVVCSFIVPFNFRIQRKITMKFNILANLNIVVGKIQELYHLLLGLNIPQILCKQFSVKCTILHYIHYENLSTFEHLSRIISMSRGYKSYTHMIMSHGKGIHAIV